MSLSGGQLSGGNTVTKRAEHDFYATDPSAVVDLLHSLDGDGVWYSHSNCLEPCVGTGNIIVAMDTLKTCPQWTYLDIINRGYPYTLIQDYLTWNTNERFDFIITNPPYSLATEFIKKSISLLADNGTCCMFLKLQFLEGQKRKQLFKKYPPKYIYVFRKRMATWKNGLEKNPDTGKKWSETICFAWFVWVKDSKTEPIIRWID